jgi:two-component sensor histidine kinase
MADGIDPDEALQDRGFADRFTRFGAAALIFSLYMAVVIPRNLMLSGTTGDFARAMVVSGGVATTFVLMFLTAAWLASDRVESRGARAVQFVLAIALVALLVPVLQFAVQCAAGTVACTLSPPVFGSAPFLALLFYSLTVGLDAVYRARNRRQEEIELSSVRARAGEARVLALKRQLNPHFLFNALNSILGISLTRPGQASAMIRNLAELLRVVTTSADALMVPLREELRVLKLYLMVEQGRFGDSLVTAVHLEPGLERALVPHMILQPVVENAIRHGRSPDDGAVSIRISASAAGERLTLTVSDSGRGLSEGLVRTGGGVGLENSASRLRELFGAKSSFQLHDSPGGGLTVALSLPLQLSESCSMTQGG